MEADSAIPGGRHKPSRAQHRIKLGRRVEPNLVVALVLLAIARAPAIDDSIQAAQGVEVAAHPDHGIIVKLVPISLAEGGDHSIAVHQLHH